MYVKSFDALKGSMVRWFQVFASSPFIFHKFIPPVRRRQINGMGVGDVNSVSNNYFTWHDSRTEFLVYHLSNMTGKCYWLICMYIWNHVVPSYFKSSTDTVFLYISKLDSIIMRFLWLRYRNAEAMTYLKEIFVSQIAFQIVYLEYRIITCEL